MSTIGHPVHPASHWTSRRPDGIEITLDMARAAADSLVDQGVIGWEDTSPDEVVLSRILETALRAGGYAVKTPLDPGSDD